MVRRMVLLGVAVLLGAVVGVAEARGPWRSSEDNTRGWNLMSPEERIEHQARIRSFKTYEECLVYQAEHHRLMESRARERGILLRGGSRDFCAHLRTGQPTH